MPIPEILQLGDPRLRTRCAPVTDLTAPAFRRDRTRLVEALEAFRREYGFGRAIAAPQIGVAQRFIALRLTGDPFVIVNPEITHRSAETFTLWDDCMSFPFLLVKLSRHRSISLRYLDEAGVVQTWNDLPPPESELLQHEIDHLDGVLALDRALDRDSLVSRTVFEADRGRFAAQVDP